MLDPLQDPAVPLASSREREDRARTAARASIGRDPVVRWAVVASVIWMLGYAAASWLLRDRPTGAVVLSELVYLVPVACAAALSVKIAVSGRAPRTFWWLLAASNMLWVTGDLLWAGYTFVLRTDAPFPSVADAVYIGSYSLVPVAVVLGFRASGSLVSARGVLDSAIIALAAGFAGWQLLIAPQLGGILDLAALTGIAYPLLGVVILVTMLAISSSVHRSVPLPVLGIAAAFAVSAVTDAGYTWLTVLNSYLPGSWLNLGWQLEAVIMCVFLLLALRHEETDQQQPSRGRDLTLVPVVGSVVLLLALLLHDLRDGTTEVSGVLVALVSLVVLLVRFSVSLADLRRTTARLDDALREQERLAITDGLTGLYNRRFITELMTIETDRARRAGTPLSLLALDIDHFKRVNDSYGHHAGDRVLVEVGRRITGALRADDVLARSGGEEFLVIANGTEAEGALEVSERIRLAVRASPLWCDEDLSVAVTVSIGCTTLRPEDSVEEVSRRADRALYAAKEAGRDRVVTGEGVQHSPGLGVDPAVLAVLERVADVVDRRLGPDEHSCAVARYTHQICRALGLNPDATARATGAARLHDIGKIDIPEDLLAKTTPLTPEDWHHLRKHPAVGADMLRGLAPTPVADLVRAHHERYDGTGYPQRLAGADIPLEARIISVADAYAAMTARRHYAPARTPAAAADELRRCSGSQFDPQVVEVLLQLLASGAVDAVDALPQQRIADPVR